jgi:hypothetical protein
MNGVPDPPELPTHDTYKSLKMPIKTLFREYTQLDSVHEVEFPSLSCDEIVEVIDDAVCRTHRIMIKTCLVMNCWILHQYHNNPDHKIDLITEDLVGTVMTRVTNPRGSTGSISKDNTEKIRLLHAMDACWWFEPEDISYLGQILNYHRGSLVTSVETNIKEHFKQYVSRYVRESLRHMRPEMLKDKLGTRTLNAHIRSVNKDFMEGTLTSPDHYHPWITNVRSSIVPPLDQSYGSHYQQVCYNPQVYLKYMIYINLELERLGAKLFQCLPLRTSIIPKYIRIDTSSLMELFVHRDSKVLSALKQYPSDVWNHFSDEKWFKWKGYTFNHEILTDGYAVSYVMSRNDIMDKKIAKNEKGRATREATRVKKREMEESGQVTERTYRPIEQTASVRPNPSNKPLVKPRSTNKKEFKGLDDIPTDQLEGVDKLLRPITHMLIDPGMEDLLTALSRRDGVPSFRYSKHQRMHETKQAKYARLLHNLRIKEGIIPIENTLSNYNSKTCNLSLFKAYMFKKVEVNDLLLKKYEDPRFRQYRWYSYINTQRSDERVVGRVTEAFLRMATQEPHKRSHKSHREIGSGQRNGSEKPQEPLVPVVNTKQERQLVTQVNGLLSAELKDYRSKRIVNKIPVDPLASVLSQQKQSLQHMTDELSRMEYALEQSRLEICELQNQLGELRREDRSNCDNPVQSGPSQKKPYRTDWSLIRQKHRFVIIIGDWSKGSHTLRGNASTPNLHLKRLLARVFDLYEIDEYNTSKVHWQTEETCDNLYCRDPATGHQRKLHRVLTYNTSGRLGCINRDNNACHNMRKLYDWYVSHRNGVPGYEIPRPLAYTPKGTNPPTAK